MPRGYNGRTVSSSDASREWRGRNPEKVRASNRKPRIRTYDAIKSKRRRAKRLENLGYRAEINRKANDRAASIRRWLDFYKLQHGCIDCGYKGHHAALHFDHVRGEKKLNVSFAKSIAQAKREIEKCEVRCANCHSVKTFRLYPCKPDIFAATYEPVE